jgi:GNAT superfamily N-acetyltransferase
MKRFDNPDEENGFYCESDEDTLTVQFLKDAVMVAVVESDLRYGYEYWFGNVLTVDAYDIIFSDNRHLYISGVHVNSKERKHKLGTKLMNRFIKEYKKSIFRNYPIVLHAIPEKGDIPLKKLIEWYGNFGFKVISGNVLVRTKIDLSGLEDENIDFS